jgi:hypothetical protein
MPIGLYFLVRYNSFGLPDWRIKAPCRELDELTMRAILVIPILAAAFGTTFSASARAEHSCDALGEPGWSTVPSREILKVADAAPYRVGADWFVDRTTTVLPLCNYINAGGNYSLRSYSLSPEDETERVMICRADAAVASYAGPCPPK